MESDNHGAPLRSVAGVWEACSQCDARAAEGGVVGALGMLCKVVQHYCVEPRLQDRLRNANLETSWTLVPYIYYASYIADTISNCPTFGALFGDEVVGRRRATHWGPSGAERRTIAPRGSRSTQNSAQ
jgi:hypothetical protein